MEFNYIRRGAGKPLLLIHGIGGGWRSWQTVLDGLAMERDVIAVDLPGHGDTPPLQGETTIATLADAVTEYLDQNNLTGIDAVGSSMGARLVLELARRGGVLGGVVSLNPGGFWQGWQVPYFYHSVNLSIKLVRALQPVMPQITNSAIGRSLLLPQFSARPWHLSRAKSRKERRRVQSGNRSSSAGGGATGLPFRANRNTRWKSFPMHSFTGSTAAGIFRNGTGRRKPSG
jgi:pimeloyl-ACP methyl ester carboxylesterase